MKCLIILSVAGILANVMFILSGGSPNAMGSHLGAPEMNEKINAGWLIAIVVLAALAIFACIAS